MNESQLTKYTRVEMPGGVEINGHMVTFPEKLEFSEWFKFVSLLSQMDDARRMWLARALAFGRERFGEEIVRTTVDQLEFSYKEIHAADALAGLPLGSWRQVLSSEHHFLVARANVPEQDRELWLERAVKHELSPEALKASLQAGKVVTDADLERRRGSAGTFRLETVEGIVTDFRRWRARVDADNPMTGWKLEALSKLREELREVHDFWIDLSVEINRARGEQPSEGKEGDPSDE